MGPAEPRAFGVNRFIVVAAPATASLMRNVSGFKWLLFSALARADLKVLATQKADLRGTNARMACACCARRPWIWRTTSRTFCADMCTLRVMAWTSIKLLCFGLGGVCAVCLEGAGQREFPEPVAHHVLGHEHRIEHLAVVHLEGQPDEIRRDHGTARPRL